ncbi:MAG TPA: hypothetical protein VM529_26025 [Gemmata sp.]|nr:hypothetical protein [Gemmata sp.]
MPADAPDPDDDSPPPRRRRRGQRLRRAGRRRDPGRAADASVATLNEVGRAEESLLRELLPAEQV